MATPFESAPKPNGRINRNGDGSITVDGGEGPRIPQAGEFDENLAERMDTNTRKTIARRLIEYYKVDKVSRKDWELREQRALKLMGIIDIPPEDADASPGVHQVTHPMLMEAAVQFQARAITEMFPPTGPVKGQIVGTPTKEKDEQRERVVGFMNYYLTQIDEGYFADTDQMLLYLPLSGSAFRKVGQNWVTGLPELRYVKATNFIAPYTGTNLQTMPRYCHEYTMSGQDVNRAIELGTFAPVDLVRPSIGTVEHSKTADVADLRLVSMHDDDELLKVLEYHIDMVIEDDPLTLKKRDDSNDTFRSRQVFPYIVIVEQENEEVLLVRRNWKEGDKKYRKRMWFAHHKYLPGLGFYGFGLPHLIGSLGRAASGAVNALLDSALASNMQGGFKTREGRAAGLAGELRLKHGLWQDVDATYEELSKSFYTPPFNQPSPALFQLLEGLVQSGQRFAGITDVATGDADNTGPVGTTLALIEQSSKPQSAIHKRLHTSFKEEYEMLVEQIHDFMPGKYVYERDEDQNKFILKQDFDGRVDVIPVSDPNIYSNTQRIAQGQAVIELQNSRPDIYPPQAVVEAHRRFMIAMRVPDVDAVAPSVETPKYLDAVSENGLMVVGKGVRAFEQQDHMGHMQIHENGLGFIRAKPMKPEELQQLETVFSSHIREHMALYYRALVCQQAGIQAPPLGPDGTPQELPPEIEAQVTAAVMQNLPTPPPPAEGETGDNGEAAAVVAKTQAAIKAKQMESEAAVARDEEEFVSTEGRAQVAWENEQARLQAAFDAEQQRNAVALERDQARADAETEAGIQRDEAAHQVKVDGMKEQGTVKTELALRQGQTKLNTDRKMGDQKLDSAAKQADHKLDSAKKLDGHKLSTAKKGDQQQLSAADQAAQQKLDADKRTTDQKLEGNEKLAQQQIEHNESAAEQQRDVKEQESKQKLQTTARMDRQKLQSAKEQARAKKQANAKSKGKK
jgi:hypothetical protein